MTDPRELGDQARNLHQLVQQPGWKELETIFAEKKNRRALTIGNDALRGIIIDPLDAAYEAGFYSGIETVLKHPDKVERRLEQALRRDERT